MYTEKPLLAAPHANALAPPEYAHSGITPSQVVSILRAYRKQSLLIAAGVFLFGAAVAAIWPRSYDATATLMVDFDIHDPLSGREFPTGMLTSYMATQIDLARDPQVLLEVVDKLGLTKNKDFTDGFSGSPAALKDWVAMRLEKHLLIEQGRFGSQLIHVTYTDDDPKLAAAVANTVADVFAEQQRTRKVAPAEQRATRYNDQLEQLKAKVATAQEQFTDFRRKAGLIDSESRYDVDVLLLSNLEQKLAEAQTARRVAEARASGDQRVGQQVLTSNSVQGLKGQLAAANARLAELSATFGPKHPQVLEVKAQIAQMKKSLDAELAVYAGNAASELASAKMLEDNLTKAVADQRAKVLQVRQLQDQAAKYQLELQSAEAVYKRALDGHDQVNFASMGGYSNVEVVSRAIPPPRPTKPKTIVALVLAFGAACGLGLALPFCWELANRRVRCRDDVERDLGLPVLIELGPSHTGAFALAGGAR